MRDKIKGLSGHESRITHHLSRITRSVSLFPTRSWVEVTRSIQFFIELFLTFSRVSGHNDLKLDVLIASPSSPLIQSLSSQSKSLATLSTRRDLNLCLSVDRRYGYGR